MIKKAQKTHILVVDDDLDMREVLEYVLGDYGYRMHACGNGREAAEWLDHHDADIIMLDLMMPIMSGQDFLEYKNQNPNIRHIPTIIMSASPSYALEGVGPNANHYLSKPFNVMKLHEIIQGIIHSRENK